MSSNTGDKENSYAGSSKDELEAALKWLEELANTQNEPKQPPLNTNPSIPLPKSPFQGMLDEDTPDLPDWMREVVSSPHKGNQEKESRLDWLTKMAQRESIEELPTLQWRRFSSSQNRISTPNAELNSEAQTPPPVELNGEPTAESTEASGLHAFDDIDAAMAWIEELAASQDAPIEDLPSVADRALASKLMSETGMAESPGTKPALPSELDRIDDTAMPTSEFMREEDSADTIVLLETIVADSQQEIEEQPESEEPVVELAEESQMAAEVELVADTQDGEPNEEPNEEPAGQPDESEKPFTFAEAMGYLEKMAQTEIEPDLPEQVVPEAELDKVAAAAAITGGIVGLANSAEAGGPEVMAESDSEITVNTLQTDPMPKQIEPDPQLTQTDDTGAGRGEVDPLLEPALTLAETLRRMDQELDDQKPSWLDSQPSATQAEAAADLALGRDQVGSHGDQTSQNLDDLLSALDRLAIADELTGYDLAGLATDGTNLAADLPDALDWLDEMLAEYDSQTEAPAAALDDETLIELMPEDPDEALAWLVQMAKEETEASGVPETMRVEDSWPPLSVTVEEPVSDAALIQSAIGAGIDELEMPDDPDAAMAWLERIAQEPADLMVEAPEVKLAAAVEPEATLPEEPAAVAAIKIATPDEPAAAIGTKPEPEPVQAVAATAPARPPTTRPAAAPATKPPPARRPLPKSKSTAWVDLLKPLNK